MASSSSVSDSQLCPPWKYDVFLSFRGEDTREIFTGHLYEGLKNRGIYTFQDDKRLEQGDSISKELMKAIEESQIALLVFSKNYAASSWCLSELVKIIECKEKNRQTVIPIFYHVDPSHVRYQSKSFAEAFTKHELRFKDDVEGMQKVQGWRTALTAAANLKGCDIRDRIESDYIQDIVDQVSSKLCKASVSFLSNVVGINAHLEKVNSLLEMEVNDVRMVGIWGMGGVGKTTIARAIFDTLSPQFDGACFLADIKENKGGLHSLQNILLSELLRKKDDYVHNKEDGKHMIARRLRFKKVLIVLDDIDHRDHLDYLAGDLCWFDKGSRIITTTRDKHLIGKNDVIYEVTPLLNHNAIKLFHQYAFKEEVPGECFKKLSLEVIDHAKGLPLALKVWGSFLHKRDITEWRSAIEQMKITSNSEIVEKLKISYDGLETIQQDMFLDIACFFRGYSKDEIMPILESCYPGATNIGLSVLIDKSLVFISESKICGIDRDTIQMHDLIQDMGKYIVKLPKNPGERSRLWDVEDVEEAMADNTGTMAVEVIWFNYEGQRWFSKDAMTNMQRLRILNIFNVFVEESDGPIVYLPNNLCWFSWYGYPWKLLPQNFNPTRLVHIELHNSLLHHLWNETKQLPSLRTLNLGFSPNLKSTPNFTGMPNLEILNLGFCKSLEEVHDSLRCSRKLISIFLNHCASLERFPYVNVESLEYLNIGYCFSLKKFPEFFGIMKSGLKIQMQRSGIREIPIILPQWCHLTELDLSGSRNLVSLPNNICKLKGLVRLRMSSCSRLETLPEGIGDLEKLEELDARYTLISRPPSSIIQLNKLKSLTFANGKSEDRANFVFPEVNEGLVSLEKLDLSCCNLIDGGLPEDIGSLSSLKVLDLRGNNFEHLPRSISQLGALQSLVLLDCERLKDLPCFTGMTNLDTLNLSFCNLIDGGLLEVIGSLSSLQVLDLGGNNFEHLPRSISQLGALQTLDLSGCKKLKELPEAIGDLERLEQLDARYTLISRPPSSIVRLNKLKALTFAKEESEDRAYFVFPEVNEGLVSLEKLDLSCCNLIDGGLPEDIGSLSSLKELDLSGNNFEHLPRSISQLGALQSLVLLGCKRLKDLPCFTGMTNLDTLNLRFCNLIDGGLPEDIGSLSSLKVLDLSGNNFEHLPRSIARLGALQSLDLSGCKRLKELPEVIGDLERLEQLDARYTLISRPPSSIVRLNKLKALTFAKEESEDRAYFVFPEVNEGLVSLEKLDLSCCNLIDGGLPEDIGSLSSLKELDLSGNNFEHLPRSISQLGALQSLVLSGCKRLKNLPCFTGMTNLYTLNLRFCNLIDGGLPEDIGSLSYLNVLDLSGNNFEHLPQSIAQLGALRTLSLSNCKRLKELPFNLHLYRIDADWSNAWLCNSLFQNISSLQPDISASEYLRVFNSFKWDMNIPRWFHHQVQDTSVSVNLPVNWYVSDNFLGFAVCYIGELNDDITAHLIPLCDDGASSMTKKFALSLYSQSGINYFLVPFAGLWDASKANGKMPNDYGCFRLVSTREMTKFGVRLLYKDELQIGMRRSRDEEGSCFSFLSQLLAMYMRR